jgi:hypothetical protein
MYGQQPDRRRGVSDLGLPVGQPRDYCRNQVRITMTMALSAATRTVQFLPVTGLD